MNNNSSERYNVEEIDNEQNIKINATEEIEDFNYIREKSRNKNKLPFLVYILIFTAIIFLGSLIFLIVVSINYNENYEYEEDIYLKPDISEHKYSRLTFDNGLEIILIQIHSDDMAGGAMTFDTGYLDQKYEPGILKLTLNSFRLNSYENYRYIREYMGSLDQATEEFYSSTYFTILNSGFQHILKNFKDFTKFSPPRNVSQSINNRNTSLIISNLLNNINEREKHLIEYLVYNISDENGTDIWRQDIGKEIINKLKNNYTQIEQITLSLFNPKKIKLIFFSHYKMSSMKKYILRYLHELIELKSNEEEKEEINNYTTLNTNKIIYHQINDSENNYIKINYYIRNNNISLNQLYKDLGYFNYLKYILDETNEDSLYYNLTHPKDEEGLNIKSLSCNYEIVLKKYIRFSIIINLNYFSYHHIKEIIEIVYNYMEKIKSHIKNSKFSDKRAEELFNIIEQNFTFSEDDHEGEYYKNKAKDLFYRDENDYFLKELWFPKDYNKNFSKIMSYMNQLTLNNSVVIVGINKNTIANYSLNETDFLIFQDLKKTSNDSNITYSDHNLEDLKLKIISDEEFKFPEYSNKFISIYKDASKIEKGSISNNDDYVPIEAEDNKEPFIKFYFIRDTSFQLPKVYINLYFFHPFLRANYSDSKNETEFLFFNMMMYISYIQREITSNLSDAIRSGNMIKIGFSENYIFIDVFAYSDLVENIIKIIKGIIFSSKDKLKLKSNFILCRDYAIEEFLNFAKVDLRQKLNYKYFEFLTKNDSDFPPIYNYYEFKKENYENSTNTTKNTDAFNYLNFPILRGFILGYYEKEEAQKIYNIFHSNFSDNFLSTIDRAKYNETKVNPISFMTSCLRRKMSTNISIVKDPLINNRSFSAYSYMYFAEYSHKSRIAVETLIKLFQGFQGVRGLGLGFRIDRLNQKQIYLSFSFRKENFTNTSVLKERIIKEINNNLDFIKPVDIVGDKYYYIMKNVESELSQKTFTMREMAMDYSYSKLYNISGSFPYEISKYDYNTFKNAMADIFSENKYFYELNNNAN